MQHVQIWMWVFVRKWDGSVTNRRMYVQPRHHVRVAETEGFEGLPVKEVGGDGVEPLPGKIVGKIPVGMAQRGCEEEEMRTAAAALNMSADTRNGTNRASDLGSVLIGG